MQNIRSEHALHHKETFHHQEAQEARNVKIHFAEKARVAGSDHSRNICIHIAYTARVRARSRWPNE